jgi:hypothetical protein
MSCWCGSFMRSGTRTVVGAELGITLAERTISAWILWQVGE